MPQELLIEFEREPFDQKSFNKDPEETLKHYIAEQSNGHHTPDTIHSIVQLVMGKDDNRLKRLLYYFFETMNKEDKGFIVCLNQVKKDLAGPNEFVRGLVLKFIATLDCLDYVLPLLRDVKQNLSNKCSYVRMNAVYCLGELGLRFDLEVEGDLLETMKRETAPQVLVVGFDVMHRLGMSFDDFLEIEYPREIAEALVEKIDEAAFLQRMLGSKFSTVSLLASCKLLSKGLGQAETIENIVRILEASPDMKQDFLPYLRFVNSHTIDLLGLVDPYDYNFSLAVIDVVFRNADPSEFMRIAEFLYLKYNEVGTGSDKKKAFRILILEKLTAFSSSHCICMDELVHQCLRAATGDDPEMTYASLGFLEVCVAREKFRSEVHGFLIANFSGMRFGKIVRKTFDVLSQSIDRKDYEGLLDRLLEDLSLHAPGEDAEAPGRVAPEYLSRNFEVFVGAHIALCLVSAYKDEWGLKPKLLGTLLKLVEVGECQGILDVSSKATIISCVRSVLSGRRDEVAVDRPLASQAHVDVLRPVEFSLLTTPLAFKKFAWSDSHSCDQSTVQLSGLGDPLYIEANCTHSRYEISLDLLVINQTSSYLQNICLDFNFSKNIQMVSPLAPFSLQPNSATTVKIQFSIRESLQSFVTATVTFKYPRKDDYSGRPFVQNLSEILFDVNEFLEGADVDFRSNWKNLEWENIYSILLRRDTQGLLQKMADKVNGHLCDKLESLGFLVGNIACYTIQRTLVLINVCISAGERTAIEIRVRSKDEELVKSTSGLLSQFLKSL